MRSQYATIQTLYRMVSCTLHTYPIAMDFQDYMIWKWKNEKYRRKVKKPSLPSCVISLYFTLFILLALFCFDRLCSRMFSEINVDLEYNHYRNSAILSIVRCVACAHRNRPNSQFIYQLIHNLCQIKKSLLSDNKITNKLYWNRKQLISNALNFKLCIYFYNSLLCMGLSVSVTANKAKPM